MNRLYDSLLQDHHNENRQMAFLTGPRQVGKTTTCKNSHKNFIYINWDNKDDRIRNNLKFIYGIGQTLMIRELNMKILLLLIY